MAKLDFSTQCPCGEKISAKIKKPTWFENSFVKVNCKCGTRFLMSCVRDKSAPPGERVFASHIDLLELSDEAKQVQSSKFGNKMKMAAARLLDKEVKPDRTKVLTSMDENEPG